MFYEIFTNSKMRIYLLLLLTAFTYSCNNKITTNTPTVKQGKIIRLETFPSQFIAARNIDIWLPDGYNSNKQYPVLYMHDGQMLFDKETTWNKQAWEVEEVISQLIKEKKIPPVIVVGIWNTKARHEEYFPQRITEYISTKGLNTLKADEVDLMKNKLISDNYLKFLVQELKPHIDQHYPTLSDKANTYIAGSSMGGLISMYAFCEYNEVFGGAACLSTHWIGFWEDNNVIPNGFQNYLFENIPTASTSKIYFDYGTETLDAFYEPHQLAIDKILKEKGYTTTNWMTKKFQGADHSEIAWNKRLHIPLVFLLN